MRLFPKATPDRPAMTIPDRSLKEAQFIDNLETDECGNKFFIDKQGRKMIYAGTARTKEDAIEAMLERAVEAEMKRRHPDTYQDPDDKAGTA